VSALLFALSGCSRRTEDPPEQAPVTNDETTQSEATEAPAAEPPKAADTLETVTAEALISKLKASGRKGTLVNAWASFCGPCKREIPMLEGLAKKLRPRGIDIVLVTVDEPGDEAKALAFLRERGIKLTSYVAARPLGEFKSGMNPRWPGMLPASFLFDREGTLRYYWGGEAFKNEIAPVLEALADGRPIHGESSPLVAPENAQ
jgi:thiol-disulfide isomerase/thioredoxin